MNRAQEIITLLTEKKDSFGTTRKIRRTFRKYLRADAKRDKAKLKYQWAVDKQVASMPSVDKDMKKATPEQEKAHAAGQIRTRNTRD